MKIAIIGYGRMGREIERIALERKHELVRIDPHSEDADFREISKDPLSGVDVAIDFTHPSVAVENISKISALGVDLVVGTTGWYDRMDEVTKIVKENGTGLIWSGNFSLGVNVLFRLAREAGRIINHIPGYDVAVHEYHHNRKADSPSGTAEMLGDILLDTVERKKTLVREKLDRPPEPEELHVSSTRCGSIPGIHSVMLDSEADSIELKHTARTRAGFALGAVMAAEFIKGRKGMHDINALMDTIMGGV